MLKRFVVTLILLVTISLNAAPDPKRIIFCIDNSSSMCKVSSYCDRNDVQNRRIDVTIDFIRSMQELSPESEVGVVSFSMIVKEEVTTGPLDLSTEENVDLLIEALKANECDTFGIGNMIDQGIAKQNKVSATRPGLAIFKALELLDSNFAQMPSEMQRLIILITDGIWDGLETPDLIYEKYGEMNPDRDFPAIYALLITNSDLHETFEKQCSSWDIDTTAIQYISEELSAGEYAPCTPQTIAGTLDSWFEQLFQKPQVYITMSVRNKTRITNSNSNVIYFTFTGKRASPAILQKNRTELSFHQLLISQNRRMVNFFLYD